jgi:hypothetical protein
MNTSSSRMRFSHSKEGLLKIKENEAVMTFSTPL